MIMLTAPLSIFGVHSRRPASMLPPALLLALAILSPAYSQSSGAPLQSGDGRLMPIGGAAGAAAGGAAPPVVLPQSSAPPAQTPLARAMSQELAPPASIPGVPTIALLDLESSTLATTESEALSQALWQGLLEKKDLRILPRRETRAWLLERDLYPFSPFGPTVSLDRVAAALRVDGLVTGRIERLGANLALTLDIFDARAQRATPLYAAPQIVAPGLALRELATASIPIDNVLHGRPAFQSAIERAAPPAVSEKAPEPGAKRRVETGPAARGNGRGGRGEGAARAVGEARGGTVARSTRATTRTLASATPTPRPTPRPRATATPATTPEPQTAATTMTAGAKPAATPAEGDAEKAAALEKEALTLGPDTTERLAKLEQAAALAPANSDYASQLAGEYYRRKQYELCVASCDRAEKSGAADSMLLMLKGTALFALKKYDDSVTANEAALKANPNNNWALHNLAVTLTAQKSPKALGAWKDYVAKAKDDPEQQSLLDEARKNIATLEKPGN